MILNRILPYTLKCAQIFAHITKTGEKKGAYLRKKFTMLPLLSGNEEGPVIFTSKPTP